MMYGDRFIDGAAGPESWKDHPTRFPVSMTPAAQLHSEFELNNVGVNSALTDFGMPENSSIHIVGALKEEKNDYLKPFRFGNVTYHYLPILDRPSQNPADNPDTSTGGAINQNSRMHYLNVDVVRRLGEIANNDAQNIGITPEPSNSLFINDQVETTVILSTGSIVFSALDYNIWRAVEATEGAIVAVPTVGAIAALALYAGYQRVTKGQERVRSKLEQIKVAEKKDINDKIHRIAKSTNTVKAR